MRWRHVFAIALLIACGWAITASFQASSSEPPSTEQDPQLAAMKESSNPVIRDFANGAFGDGHEVKDLIIQYPPTWIARHGPYTDVVYGDPAKSGICVFAREGRIYYALAFSPGASYSFFCTASQEQLTARQMSFETYRLNNSFQAVLGSAGAACEFPRDWLFKPNSGN